MLTRARKGFTLLELIVVIVILGILAALAIPTFQSVINKSKQSSIETTAASVGRSAVAQAAFDENGATSTEVTEAAGEAGATSASIAGLTVADSAVDVNDGKNGFSVTKDGKTACITIGTGVNGQVEVEDCPA